jgi:DNA-directed RNA polymerase subunit F
MGEIRPFEFKQCESILKSTGKKAGNLHEMRNMISVVSDASLIHHTYQYFMKGHTLEYTNDFAQWAGESLEERALSEELSNIDPYQCTDVDELRGILLGVIEGCLDRFPEPREAIPGDEFHFNETITMVFPVGVQAKNLAEFLIAVKYIDTGSMYYHFYDARVRLRGGYDDFSQWIGDVLGKKELADRIRAIDPFMHSIEGIRERVADAVEGEVRRDMEKIGF